MRAHQRAFNELREITLTRHYTKHAEGSVLVKYGDTHVLCTASIIEGVPRFLKGKGQGWLTAEYGMLPRSTHERMEREAARGRQTGRTQEIQRLIGRALRNAVDLKKLGENTITIDCDVLQADGGTRTAAITGGCVALIDAIRVAQAKKIVTKDPFQHLVAAISVGIYQGHVMLDLDYKEDSKAETDMNIVMTEKGGFIEIQGTAEGQSFEPSELNSMLAVAQAGIQSIIAKQREILA